MSRSRNGLENTGAKRSRAILVAVSQVVVVFAKGRVAVIEETLRNIRLNLGPANCAIWLPPRWQPADYDPESEVTEDRVDVELINSDRQADAIHRVAQAVGTVDPDRQVITGGDIDKTPLQ